LWHNVRCGTNRKTMSVVKISPGKGAKNWKKCCSKNRHICVGFSKADNLRKYKSEDELREAVSRKLYDRKALGTAARVARQLWILRNLRRGDGVIASKGNSIVVGVGEVTRPYQWNEKRASYRHIVGVKWDKSFKAKKIPPQKEWNNNTVCDDVPPKLFKLITGKSLPPEPPFTEKTSEFLGELVKTREVSTRGEQDFLRRKLLKGKNHGRCFLCGDDFPVELLVAAHIKPRSECTDKECRDREIVVPMCLLGCDALFERGYVTVKKTRIVTHLKSATAGSRLKAIFKTLRQRSIDPTDNQKKYFAWHGSCHRA
jgi:hypothetical protein